MSATYHLSVSSDVVAARYDSGWSVKASVKPLIEDIGYAQQMLTSPKWAFYDDIRNWPIKSPEQIKECSDAAIKMIENGLRHCVICGRDIGVSHWMMEKIFADKVTLAFFSDPSECIDWLKNQAYNAQFQPIN